MLFTHQILDVMIRSGSRPAEFRKLDLQRLNEAIDLFKATETPHTREQGGPSNHAAQSAIAFSVPLAQASPIYMSSHSNDLTNERGDVHGQPVTISDNIEMLEPDQLLSIASLFEHAPGYYDEHSLDGDHSWLWSN